MGRPRLPRARGVEGRVPVPEYDRPKGRAGHLAPHHGPVSLKQVHHQAPGDQSDNSGSKRFLSPVQVPDKP